MFCGSLLNIEAIAVEPVPAPAPSALPLPPPPLPLAPVMPLASVMPSASVMPPAPPRAPEQPIYKQPELQIRTPTTVRPPVFPPVTPAGQPPQKSQNSKKSILLIIGLLLLGGIVFGSFYYQNTYLPAKIDREAPRFYTVADNTFLRSSQEVGVDYNRIAKLPYGSELITYSHYEGGWSEVKDAAGHKGWVASAYILTHEDFSKLNAIFGDTESRECINTTKCRNALLSYFKSNTLGSEWKVFCRPKDAKLNNVYYTRIVDRNSKFTDFAVIIRNTNTNERKVLIFGFNEDESLAWTKHGDAPNNGYIKKISLNSTGQIHVEYSN
jgi:uncharacterized protein YgiM (DUF1202 family)